MATQDDDHSRWLVGTWTFTKPDQAQQTPLYLLVVPAAGETMTMGAATLSASAAAVYYGAREPGEGDFLLLHNDLDLSALSRQRIAGDGSLEEVGRWSSGGVGGSYIAFDATGAYFIVANAHTGWNLFRNAPVPQAIADIAHQGCGPHPRQGRSHPHCAMFSPDNAWIYAADMGSDEVLAFAFEAACGLLGEKRLAYRAVPGSGPRHILCREDMVYLLNELGNTLVVLRAQADGTLEPLQIVSTLPGDFDGFSHTAHLAFDHGSTRLLASNRGHDSIVAFDLDAQGRVIERHWSPSGGEWPWFFSITDEGNLLVANTMSDRVSLLRRSGSGYSPVADVTVPRPVFLARY